MNRMTGNILKLAGAIAPVLGALTTYYIATLIPEYSPSRQFISELGETGSVTEPLKRYITNYPIGILYISLGAFIVIAGWKNKFVASPGLLIIVHGLTNIATGMFPCDPGCLPSTPSLSQKIHNISAATGLCAPLLFVFLWVFFANKQTSAHYLIAYSMATVAIAAISIALMSLAMKTHGIIGLYQRIGVRSLYLWLMFFFDKNIFALAQLQQIKRVNLATKLTDDAAMQHKKIRLEGFQNCFHTVRYFVRSRRFQVFGAEKRMPTPLCILQLFALWTTNLRVGLLTSYLSRFSASSSLHQPIDRDWSQY